MLDSFADTMNWLLSWILRYGCNCILHPSKWSKGIAEPLSRLRRSISLYFPSSSRKEKSGGNERLFDGGGRPDYDGLGKVELQKRKVQVSSTESASSSLLGTSAFWLTSSSIVNMSSLPPPYFSDELAQGSNQTNDCQPIKYSRPSDHMIQKRVEEDCMFEASFTLNLKRNFN